MAVDFRTEKGRVVRYSVVLMVADGAGVATVRVYDSAHGFNEMHRFTRSGGKEKGIVFSRGTLGDGLSEAIDAVKGGYREMIEGWATK